MNLFEKLNRLDDGKSLRESTKMVTKKKLTESLAANEYELTYYNNSAARDRRPETVEDVYDDWKTVVFRADSNLDAWKEAFERVTGDYYDDFLEEDATEADFSSYFEDSDWGDGSPILIKLSSAEGTLYDTGYTRESWIEEYVEDDYDDDIDEMLTESAEQYELSTLVKDSINHLVNNLGKDPMADDFGDDVCADLEDNYDIHVPENPVKYADWCDAVMCEVSRQLNNKEEQLTEGNNVSSQLPSAIDSFLQDIAQMYGTITYKDIMKHQYTEEDLKSLRNYRRKFRAEIPHEGENEADAVLKNIAEKVALIVKR